MHSLKEINTVANEKAWAITADVDSVLVNELSYLRAVRACCRGDDEVRELRQRLLKGCASLDDEGVVRQLEPCRGDGDDVTVEPVGSVEDTACRSRELPEDCMEDRISADHPATTHKHTDISVYQSLSEEQSITDIGSTALCVENLENLWRTPLPYGYSYKASCATPG